MFGHVKPQMYSQKNEEFGGDSWHRAWQQERPRGEQSKLPAGPEIGGRPTADSQAGGPLDRR